MAGWRSRGGVAAGPGSTWSNKKVTAQAQSCPAGAATRDARSTTRNGPKKACDGPRFHGLHTEEHMCQTGQWADVHELCCSRKLRFELAKLH